ncbi:MAG: PleD family two-component system response regulator [Alphaproteobacteria bacterium]|nr:PleD family two-component system response regulator [Alphaproteobacteria bacterium]
MSARILVVDDILPNVKLLEAKLLSDYYQVVTATSGEEALQKASSESPDIVLLDVMMPGMDGFEVCRRLKENPQTTHIPVVMVTALTDAQDRIKGLEAGADDFLSKPLNDIALMARVRSLVRLKMTVDEWKTREKTANQLGVGDEGLNAMREPVEHARILVVNDIDFENEKMKSTFAADQDDVICAKTGFEALDIIAQSDPFELIVVSSSLKGEDGLRLCSHFRSNEKTRATPIVLIANDNEMPRVAQGLEMGVHDYILRPVDQNELLARIRIQIRRRRFQERLRTNYESSLSLAVTDSLTGLYNRRYFETHLQKLLEKNKEARKTLAVLYMDIDHFKSINDRFGHNVGDEVLKIYAERLKNTLRSFDLLARLGGEEFVVILPDITRDLAYQVAERLRRLIADRPFKVSIPDGQLVVTASIGGVVIDDGDHNLAGLLDRADKQLYEAKQGGRNCVFFEDVGVLDPAKFTSPERKFIE